MLAENPHFVFTDRERRGYGVAEFTPRQLEVSLRAVDDVTRTDSGISTLARFAVEQGQPKLHQRLGNLTASATKAVVSQPTLPAGDPAHLR